jgi:hypothetical protein
MSALCKRVLTTAAFLSFALSAPLTALSDPAIATAQTTGTCASALRNAAFARKTPDNAKPFILVTAVNGYRELLSLPSPAPASIDSMRLLPAASESAPLTCVMIRLHDDDGMALRGAQCNPLDRTPDDSGPIAHFSGIARGQYSAVVRVLVNETGSAAKTAIDDSVAFSVDGGPGVIVPAKGIEPVYVSSTFQYLAEGPHRITYVALHGQEAPDPAPQGVVCI